MPRENFTEQISVRLTIDDVQQLRRKAKKHGLTVAGYFRFCALRTMRQETD